MTNETVYKSKGGYTPAGPERWKRARLNAEKRPDSAAAKLYRERCDTADCVSLNTEAAPLTLAKAHVSYVSGPARTQGYEHLCSPYCAALRLQLYYGTWEEVKVPNELIELISAATDGQLRVNPDSAWDRTMLGPLTAKKPVTCRVCGITIDPADTATPKLDALLASPSVFGDAAPGRRRYLVTSEGELFELDSVRILELTDEEYLILDRWSTPELRWECAAELGHRVE